MLNVKPEEINDVLEEVTSNFKQMGLSSVLFSLTIYDMKRNGAKYYEIKSMKGSEKEKEDKKSGSYWPSIYCCVKEKYELIGCLKSYFQSYKPTGRIFVLIIFHACIIYIWPKRDENGEWRRLHNEKLHSLYRSPNIVRVIKSRRLRWADWRKVGVLSKF